MEKYGKDYLEQLQLANECIEESSQKFNEGKLKNAEAMAVRAKDIYEKLDEKEKVASTLNFLSIIYDEMGNENMHMECLLDALELSIDENINNIAVKLYNNLGSKLMYLKDYDRALLYLEKAQEIFRKVCPDGKANDITTHSFLTILNLNLSTTYCALGDKEKAKKYYRDSKYNYEHSFNPELNLTYTTFEGMILWNLDEKEEAKKCVENIMETARATEYSTDYFEVMSDFLDLLSEMKDFEKWEEALKLISTHMVDAPSMQLRILRRWVDYYKASGNEKKYEESCIKYFELSKEMAESNYKRRADAIELRAEMRRADRQKRLTDSIVYLDPLTGVGNRNKLLDDSKEYIEKFIAEKICVTVGLIDIDFFKECNDTYGHVEGDNCLKKVAGVIKEVLGEEGNVYRYGGDEFLVVIPGISSDRINEFGKTIREKIAAEKIDNCKSPICPYVTVSQGYTQAYAEEGDTIDQLVNLADHVLYQVKRYGRNNYKFIEYNDVVADIAKGR